jgi:SAM-dependent methyltransferase
MAVGEIQPKTIEAITGSVDKAYALLAGLKLDLFTALQDGPLTTAELAGVVQGDPRRLSGLLYFLVGTGLLTVADERFANTPEADRWLVRGRPGSFVESAGFWSELWHGHSQTDESIRAGHALANHDYTTMSPDELRVVYRSFDKWSRKEGEWLASTFDFATCQTLIDVGGGPGGLAVTLTERHPQIQATVADLPSVIPVTQRFLQEADAADRVRTAAIDLLTTPIPGSYDVAVLRNVVQLFTPENAGRLLRSVGTAVRPGGTIYVIGHAVDDTRLGPMAGLSFNFVSISFYEDGQAYTEWEYRTWLEEAGFRDVEVRWDHPIGVPVLIIGHKRG